MQASSEIHPASFRDPAGHVYDVAGRIYRTVSERAASDYEFVRDSGFLEAGRTNGTIIGAAEVDASSTGIKENRLVYVLEHPRLDFISYPYEWSFSLLKRAALFHLDLHLQALDSGITLSDASAYNIQMRGVRPLFIDILSLRPYRDGEFWIGHRQFCEQFLNPLLLRAVLGVAHNAWYRGRLEGIDTQSLTQILPWYRKCSWRMLAHVTLQARVQNSAIRTQRSAANTIKTKKLSKLEFVGILEQLRSWIAGLAPGDIGQSVWGNYTDTHTYTSVEMLAKRRFVSQFVEQIKPRLLWDLGCNTGEFSELALKQGAQQVIGFEFDQVALEQAYARADDKSLNFTPLNLDAANPSPEQGWNQLERAEMQSRSPADATLALAFVHHLAIARNVPLAQVVKWIVGLAPCGLIEFVQKHDPTVQEMLSLREDIFSDYSEEAFVSTLNEHARIVRSETVSEAGRKLFWFENPGR